MAALKDPRHRWRYSLAAALVIVAVVGVACLSTSPKVVRIGFVAPFEGRYREIGDQVIAAARLAVRDYAARYPDNHLVVELVAYDDRGIPDLAVEQANKLVADPEVVAVVGHWRDETTRAALPVYQKAGIPVITFSPANLPASGVENLSPSLDDMRHLADEWNGTRDAPVKVMLDEGAASLDTASALTLSASRPAGNAALGGPTWGLNQFHSLAAGSGLSLYFVTGSAYPADLSSDETWPAARVGDFVSGYEKGSLGAPPGLLSVTAYEATWLAITRAAAHAGHADVMSPTSPITFDASGRRVSAPIYLYRWDKDVPHLVKRLR